MTSTSSNVLTACSKFSSFFYFAIAFILNEDLYLVCITKCNVINTMPSIYTKLFEFSFKHTFLVHEDTPFHARFDSNLLRGSKCSLSPLFLELWATLNKLLASWYRSVSYFTTVSVCREKWKWLLWERPLMWVEGGALEHYRHYIRHFRPASV